MHRLVQLSVRTWLKIHQQLTLWQEKSRVIMAHKFLNGNYETWSQCRTLVPHAKEVLMTTINKNDQHSFEAATISSNCGWYLHLQGAYAEAETMVRRALLIIERAFGPEHHDTLVNVSRLGVVLHAQGKHEDAEAIHRLVLEA
jgi:hypothetical protein